MEPSGWTEVDDKRENVSYFSWVSTGNGYVAYDNYFCIVILENVTLNVQLNTICLVAGQNHDHRSDILSKALMREWKSEVQFLLRVFIA